MTFWEKNMALPITGSFTWCPGPAATHRLGSTLGGKGKFSGDRGRHREKSVQLQPGCYTGKPVSGIRRPATLMSVQEQVGK